MDPGSESSPAVGNGNPLQFSCLENSMDRGACQATVHEISKSQTWLNDWAQQSKQDPPLQFLAHSQTLHYNSQIFLFPYPSLHHSPRAETRGSGPRRRHQPVLDRITHCHLLRCMTLERPAWLRASVSSILWGNQYLFHGDCSKIKFGNITIQCLTHKSTFSHTTWRRQWSWS